MNYYQGKPIMYMQKCLRKLSYYYPITRVMPTGVFDDNTRSAVIDFERYFSLKVTGEISNDLYEKIDKEYNNIITNTSPIKYDDFNFKYGESSDIVSFFQVMNNLLNKKYSNIKKINITGIMDEETVNEVKIIREVLNLENSDMLDKKVLKGLFDIIKG